MSGQKRNWKKCVGIVCGVLFALYVFTGFIALPLLLRYVGLRMVNDGLAGTVSVQAIRVNPFSWSLLLRGIEVKTPEGQSVASASRFYGNFAFWSLFGKGWRFQEVHLAEPSLNVAVDANGQLNLLQLLKPAVPDAPAADAPAADVPAPAADASVSVADASASEGVVQDEPIVIPLIRVDRLWVENGGFELSLALPGGEFHRQGKNINLDLTHFSTDPQSANPYAFIAQTAHGESVRVEGQLRLNPLSTKGTVTLDTIRLEDFDLFTADTIGVTVDSGSLSLAFDYLFSPVSEPRGLFVENGSLFVADVKLAARTEPQPFARLGKLELTGFGVDLLDGSVKLDSIHVADAALRIVRDNQGVLNLIRYVFPEDRQREIVDLVQAEIAAARSAERNIRLGVVSDNQDLGVAISSAWHQIEQLLALTLRFNVGELLIEHNTLELRDEFPSVPVDFVISDIGLKASDLRNHGSEPFPFEFGLRTGGAKTAAEDRGAVSASGSFIPQSDKGEFTYEVSGFDLVPFAPYLAAFTTAELVSAKVGSRGEGSVAFPAGKLPLADIIFSGTVDNLRVDDPADGRSVLEVKSIALTRTEAKTEPLYFVADALRIVNPSLRVVRNKEGQINLIQMVPMLAGRLAPAEDASAGNAAAGSGSGTATAGAAAVTGAASGGKVVSGTVSGGNATSASAGAAGDASGSAAGNASVSAAGDASASVAQEQGDAQANGTPSAADWQTRMVDNAVEAAKHSQAAAAFKSASLDNIALKKLEIVGGSVTIVDESVDPRLSFQIRDASLAVNDISLKAGNVTTFNASARLANGVDGVVSDISGEFVTLDPLKSAKLNVAVQDISLGGFGGYSEPAVGRPIDKGTLTGADLSYTIADGKMRGENRVRMQSVGFASRRESSTGPRLPLDLGIAILSDRNGQMRLDVPVSGDLRDPAFDLSRVIQYAIVNVLERLVTAPFAVLGSLLGSDAGGEGPATSVVFEAGQSQVPLGQLKGLGLLASALYERPTLALRLLPVTNDAADLAALREQLLEQRLQAYADQHRLTQDRAVERLYDQLMVALPSMDPQARAGIEAMVAQASARAAAQKAQADAAATPLVLEALAVPLPVVEGESGGQLQTVNVRSVTRARRGAGFIATIEPVQVLVAAAPVADASATAGANGSDVAGADGVAADGTGSGGVAAARDGGATAVQPVAAAEPSVADKRSILLAQTIVTQSAVQGLANARMEAIAGVLEADESHPLAAERIVKAQPWKPNPQAPEQVAITGVYFDLGALDTATAGAATTAPAEAVPAQ